MFVTPATKLFPDDRNDAEDLYRDTLELRAIECSLRTVCQTLAAHSLFSAFSSHPKSP